jgi:hypothetical protein
MVGEANRSERKEKANHKKKRMANIWLGSILLAAMVLACSSSQAVLITYEGFPYAPTGLASIDGKSGGIGWDANWGQFVGGATSYGIMNGGLSFGSLYTSSNRVFTTGGLAGRFFTEPSTFYGTAGTTNYFSVLIRPENTPAVNHYYGLQLWSNGADCPTPHDVFVGKNGSSLNYGLEYSTNDVSGATNVFIHTYSSTAAASNQTVLLVVRVIFAPAAGCTPDSFSLYVNPTPGGAEPVTPDATLNCEIGQQNGIALNAGNGARVSFDEVRMGYTFASVTATTSLPPNLLTYEPFEYNQSIATTTLDGMPNDGTQASNGWDNVTWGQFLGGATNYTIAAGSLSDPSGKLITSGNRTQTTAPPPTTVSRGDSMFIRAL